MVKTRSRPVIEPGIHFDIPAKEYFSSQGIGSTGIRKADQESVAHVLASEYKETAAMRMGTMSHTAILEHKRFDDTYVVAKTGPCQGKTKKDKPCTKNAEPGSIHCWQHDGREEAEAWRNSLPEGTEVVTQDEVDAATDVGKGVREAIARSDYPDILDDNNPREVTVVAWATVDDDGYSLSLEETPGAIMVKGRLDLFVTENMTRAMVVDIKGASRPQGTSDRIFRYRVIDSELLVQAKLYTDLIRCCTGKTAPWMWLVHEQSAPYAVRLYRPKPHELAEAQVKIAEGLRRWKEYNETGNAWLGWRTDCATVSISTFAKPTTSSKTETIEPEMDDMMDDLDNAGDLNDF